MALRAVLRRTSTNAIWSPNLQIAKDDFCFTNVTPSYEFLKRFVTAKLDLFTGVRADIFACRNHTKSIIGAIVGSQSFYKNSSFQSHIRVPHGDYVPSPKNDFQLCSNGCSLSKSRLLISSSYAAQPWSNLAANSSFDRCHFSTAGENIISGKGRDEQGKCAPVRENLESPAANGKTWIQIILPMRIQPFAHLARLDRPIGTWLLAWPCFWSICLAAPSGSFPDLKMISLFGLGAILLRGAGCTVNDLLDSDIDGKVERTRERPLASGALTTPQGVGFLGCQLLLGLGVLLQLNDFSRILGASSLLLVGTYPLMKRWTYWPQAFLGLTFNWGALLGWAAVHGNLDLSVVLPLYASGVSWTLVYDTIYAHQDKEDDLKVGVMSTALRFGGETKTWLAGFSAVCVSGLTMAGFNADLGWPFYAGLIASAGHLAWQVSSVDIHNRADCNSKFVSNKWFGAMVCSAIVAGKLVT